MYFQPKREPKLLVVDDDAGQLMLLNKTLSDIGQILFAQDGQTGMELAINAKPDVILLDIEMPGLDGWEVLDRLKLHPATDQIPVIFLTAHDSTEHQIRCLKAGAVDFIGKPVQAEVVAARVHTQLRLRQRERELVEAHRHAKVTLESIGDAVITTDSACCVTYMNPTAEMMTGFALVKALGQPIEKIMPLRIGKDGPTHVNPVRIAINEQRIVGMALDCEMQTQRGRWMAVEDSAAPLVSESGEVIGGVIVFHDVSEARAMAIKMAHMNQYDQLTNLPNRLLLMDRMESEIGEARRDGRKVGLMIFNIDHFRLVNEEFGFEYGDVVLKDVAQRVKGLLKRGETLSRHNADEFMVLVPNIDVVSDLSDLAVSIREQVMDLVAQHPQLDALPISLGVSVYPDDALDPQGLLWHADAALDKARRDTSSERLCFFSDEIEASFLQRRMHNRLLKKAIAEDGIVALYQPIVDSQSGQLVAVEALMRIRDEDGQLLPPAEFVKLAEETRLMLALGEKMIHIVLTQLRRWMDDGRRIRVCMNISPLQFVAPQFLPFLEKAIEEHRVDASMIELEVTESLMMQNIDQVTHDMQQMRQRGMTISIDDFGTGFSCLTYLNKLPIDTLKIDRAFVAKISTDQSDDLLVNTITTMAKNMGLGLIAEGVESSAQVVHLRNMGVAMLQGYYFSRAVPAVDVQDVYRLVPLATA